MNIKCLNINISLLILSKMSNNNLPYKKYDWNCDQCNELNFGTRIKCRKCSANKPEKYANIINEKAINDWTCNYCKEINFSYRENCRNCMKHKSHTLNNTNYNDITIATWNVCGDHKSEKVKETMWDNRYSKIVTMLNNDKYDVVCLQELRNHSTSSINMKTFLTLLNKFDYCYTPYSEFESGFYIGILYKPSKLIPVAYNQFHYNDSPSNDKICYGVKMKFKNSNNYFWIYTTHLGMESEEKIKSINKIIDKLGDTKEPTIVAGDFNLFNDDNGDMLRNKISEKFTDMAYPLKGLNGTFVGFNHDDYKANKLTDMSRLDYIFCRNIEKKSEAEAVDFSLERLLKRDYPSDHLMIEVKLIVPNNVDQLYW